MKARLALAGALVALGASAPRDAAAQCRGRPTDPGGYQGYTYGQAEVKSLGTPRVRVHYATSGSHAPDLATTRQDGVPDTVAFVADTADDALRRFGELGFRAPPGDAACASNGGDAALDIYLVKFAGADGSTVPEACTGSVCSSFMLVESTFQGRGYPTVREGFTTVVVHELFHAVQNAYDSDMDRFWAEGTAQWAMKVLHPELVDFERQLPAFFADPQRSLDTQPSGVTAGYLYGSAVWPLFLTLRHGDGTVREILEAEAAGQKTIPATEAVLGAKGSSLAEDYPLFGAWNAATKSYAGAGGYPDAAKYPGIESAPLEDGASGITSGLAYFVYAGTLDAPAQIALETDGERNAGVVVPVEGGKAVLDRVAALPANASGEVLVVVAGITTKKTDAPFTVRLLPPTAEPGGSSGGASSGGASSGGGDDGGCAVARSGREDALATALLVCGVAVAARGRRRRSARAR